MYTSKKKLKCFSYFYIISKYYQVSTYGVYRIMKNHVIVFLVNVGKWTLSHSIPTATALAISFMDLQNGDTNLERFLPKN